MVRNVRLRSDNLRHSPSVDSIVGSGIVVNLSTRNVENMAGSIRTVYVDERERWNFPMNIWIMDIIIASSEMCWNDTLGVVKC